VSAIFVVALGALIGAPARAAIERFIAITFSNSRFPWALISINISGSLIAGIVIVATTGNLQLFLLVGFAGAFTTFSGWTQVIRTGYKARSIRSQASAVTWTIAIGIGVMVVCVLAAWIGTLVGSTLL
jgi:fluoride exporter